MQWAAQVPACLNRRFTVALSETHPSPQSLIELPRQSGISQPVIQEISALDLLLCHGKIFQFSRESGFPLGSSSGSGASSAKS